MAEESKDKNPVGWFEIYVQDLDRAKRFYESVFEVKIAAMPNTPKEVQMLVFPMDMGGMGASGALVKMDGFPSGGNSVLVYFMTGDCAVTAKRVPSAGGKVVKEKMSIGENGWIALATDTEGNMFGMHSMK